MLALCGLSDIPVSGVVTPQVVGQPLCLLGVRYPVRMMPLLMFEFTWKLIRVLAAWLPAYLGHRLDPDTAAQFAGIFPGVVVPLVLPWGYFWRAFVATLGDRWQ